MKKHRWMSGFCAVCSLCIIMYFEVYKYPEKTFQAVQKTSGPPLLSFRMLTDLSMGIFFKIL